MVEVDEFDPTATAQGRGTIPGGPAVIRHPRRITEHAGMWVATGLALVLIAVLTTPRPTPPMTLGTLLGDLTRPPTLAWSVPLPPALADDTILVNDRPLFTGGLAISSTQPPILVGTSRIGVAGLDAATGALLWQHEISGSLCTVSTAVACVHASGKWRASVSFIDPVTGLRSTYPVPGAMEAVAVRMHLGVENGTRPGLAVIAADGRGTWLALLDATDGSERWRMALKPSAARVVLLAAGTHVYLSGPAPAVVDVDTGQLVGTPAQVRPGPESTVEVVALDGGAHLVLADGEQVELASPLPDEGGERMRPPGAATPLPGSVQPVQLLTSATSTTAIDLRTGDALWTEGGPLACAVVSDGDLIGAVDGILVRWTW